jgi:hypothetical protein
MQRVLNTSKNYKYQSALPTLYTPHSILPYSYCQDGGCVPVIYGVVKIAGAILYSGFAVFTSNIAAWQDAYGYFYGDLVVGSDNYIYKCKLLNTSAYTINRPSTGTIWSNYWERVGSQGGVYMALWLGVGCGKLELLAIYKNTDTPLVDGTDYTSAQYNDGTGTYYPDNIRNAAKLNNDPYGGIAHILFGGAYSLSANPDEKIPDTRIIVARRLAETISHTELFAPAVYSYYGNTWAPQFTYHNDGWEWTYGGKILKPFFVIYNKMIRLLVDNVHSWVNLVNYNIGDLVTGTDGLVYRCIEAHASIDYYNKPITGTNWNSPIVYWELYNPSHLSTWEDWIGDEPPSTNAIWSYAGYEWSLQGENFYPWNENKVYSVPVDRYKQGDFVIGKDNNVYFCTVEHVPDYNNEPSVGTQWQEFWNLFGWNYNVLPPTGITAYPTGIIVIAEDGLAYRCTQENTYPNHLPVSSENWQEYWQLAKLPPWINNKYYYLSIDIYLPGMIKLGSDGQRYVCKFTTDLSPENMPVTGFFWQDFWYHNPTQFPVTSDQIVCGTDGKAYTTTNILGVTLSDPSTRPVSGSDWPDVWNETLAPDIFLGNNPAAIAYDILTNTFYGLAIPAAKIDIDSFNIAAVYYNSKDYGLNIKVTDIGEAKKVLNQMLDWCDMVLTVGVNGLIQCKVFDPAAESIGTLSDEDYASFSLTKQSWRDLYNEFEATYSDPARLYEATSIVLKNEAAIEMAGGIVKKKTFDLTAFTNRTICANRLNEIMRRESYPRNTVSCEVSGAWYFARPCDLIKIIKSEYGINNYFRIVSVGTGKIDELNISLELIDATEVMFDQWDNPIVTTGRRRLISPMGAPFTQGKI